MGQQTIAVSIMVHNDERVIEKCLRSLLSQRLEEESQLEIFVIANAWTDMTCEIILKKCQHVKNLHLIEVKEKGKSHAIRIFKECMRKWNESELTEGKRILNTLLEQHKCR